MLHLRDKCKVSTFHNKTFIANALPIELYNRSAIWAILDMQISRFFKFTRGNPSVFKKNLKI